MVTALRSTSSRPLIASRRRFDRLMFNSYGAGTSVSDSAADCYAVSLLGRIAATIVPISAVSSEGKCRFPDRNGSFFQLRTPDAPLSPACARGHVFSDRLSGFRPAWTASLHVFRRHVSECMLSRSQGGLSRLATIAAEIRMHRETGNRDALSAQGPARYPPIAVRLDGWSCYH